MADKQTKKLVHTMNAQRKKEIEYLKEENSRMFVEVTNVREARDNYKFWKKCWALGQGLGIMILGFTLDYIADYLNIRSVPGHGTIQHFIVGVGFIRATYGVFI